MMPTFYVLNVTLHVLAAMLWLGGMMFLGLVGAPVLRTVEPPALRQQLFQLLGLRFRAIGWWAIGVLVVTGVGNLHFRGWLRWEGVLGDGEFWRGAAGHALALKLGCVTVMLAVEAVHDFALGPMAGAAEPGSPRALELRRRAAFLARFSAVVGVLVVIAAVRLARGG
jgi:uncharacterized membrane protein